jgi:hypothetical protein
LRVRLRWAYDGRKSDLDHTTISETHDDPPFAPPRRWRAAGHGGRRHFKAAIQFSVAAVRVASLRAHGMRVFQA